eukprot:CAMPEP_0172457554 /NCGR_PEP_ID=MMETSP1065-20121228/22762_1 /TAXON_ID=265537 /ORGANISM="Amphiprora paludosa, Strain CCMP125" /LENGTH=140 /DNA_ID=CAMNT_0013211361 /DNA_START=73 /DNA_END=495 /DNA_ORIENTATION=+
MRSATAFLFILCACAHNAFAFTTIPSTRTPVRATPLSAAKSDTEPQKAVLDQWVKVSSTVALTMSTTVLPAMAEVDSDVQFAELPPPYVPALFGVGLLVGVGLLTGSLGNVMDEEASLGMQSGARAKKEIERSRSSYFKK